MFVHLLRWLSGFIDFSVSGKFPERFLNLAAKNGVYIWNMKGEKNQFIGRAKKSDIPLLEKFCKKTNNQLKIHKEYGFPLFVQKYQCRLGLFTGAVFAFCLCSILSGYIWNIEIHVPKSLNEYEIRHQLSELGFYEGAFIKNQNIRSLRANMQLKNQNISWITINLFGSRAVIDMSGDIPKKQENSSEKNQNMIQNLFSKADGTVTKIQVQNGTAMIHTGDGVRKGQLLVSGVMVYTNGNHIIAESKATIMARTSGKIQFTIPKNIQKPILSQEKTFKKSLCFSNIEIPLTLNGEEQRENISSVKREQLVIFGNTVPIYFKTEEFQLKDTQAQTLDSQTAKKILDNRMKLYQVFLLNSLDSAEILSFQSNFQENEKNYHYSANYELEENICENPD